MQTEANDATKKRKSKLFRDISISFNIFSKAEARSRCRADSYTSGDNFCKDNSADVFADSARLQLAFRHHDGDECKDEPGGLYKSRSACAVLRGSAIKRVPTEASDCCRFWATTC